MNNSRHPRRSRALRSHKSRLKFSTFGNLVAQSAGWLASASVAPEQLTGTIIHDRVKGEDRTGKAERGSKQRTNLGSNRSCAVSSGMTLTRLGSGEDDRRKRSSHIQQFISSAARA